MTEKLEHKILKNEYLRSPKRGSKIGDGKMKIGAVQLKIDRRAFADLWYAKCKLIYALQFVKYHLPEIALSGIMLIGMYLMLFKV